MSKSIIVFNSSIEAGVRSIAILNAFHPHAMDFEGLIKVDYIIVNSGDFGGPESIHSITPNRIGEIAARRETVREGISLMRRFGMIELDFYSDGVNYKATDSVQPYLRLMRSDYSKRLLSSANWLADELKLNSFNKFDLVLSEMAY